MSKKKKIIIGIVCFLALFSASAVTTYFLIPPEYRTYEPETTQQEEVKEAALVTPLED